MFLLAKVIIVKILGAAFIAIWNIAVRRNYVAGYVIGSVIGAALSVLPAVSIL